MEVKISDKITVNEETTAFGLVSSMNRDVLENQENAVKSFMALSKLELIEAIKNNVTQRFLLSNRDRAEELILKDLDSLTEFFTARFTEHDKS